MTFLYGCFKYVRVICLNICRDVTHHLVGVEVDDVLRSGGGRRPGGEGGPAARAGAGHEDLARALLLQRHGHGVAAAEPACVDLRTHLLHTVT